MILAAAAGVGLLAVLGAFAHWVLSLFDEARR